MLLGEKLPRPPKDVPQLPADETATDGLTVRELVAKHTSEARCASCHQEIDPFGFALEGFDAIGRRRDTDLAGRPIDTRTKLPDGNEIDGLPGLRDYLLKMRGDAVLRQFCRKLLGYAHRPGAAALRRAAARRNAAAAREERLPFLRRRRDDRAESSVPGDPGERF